MPRFQLILAALILGALTGCGSGLTVDGSSPESAKKSLAEIKKSLAPAEATQFESDLTLVTTTREPAAYAGASPKQRTLADTYKSIDGMSAADIRSKAEKIRADAKAKKAAK